jgi:secreted trypsin-like serine protease
MGGPSDIAIIKVASALGFFPRIELMTTHLIKPLVLRTVTAEFAGWGRSVNGWYPSSSMKHVRDMNLVDDTSADTLRLICSQILKGKHEICAYSNSKTLQVGDSGGPLIINDADAGKVQIGLLVRGALSLGSPRE